MLTLLRALFVLATTVFVGNIILLLVWKLGAERTREPRILLFANQTIMLTDKFFLGLSAMLVAISGNLLAYLTGVSSWTSPTLTVSMIFFILSGVVWFLFLVPTQKAQLKICTESGATQELPERYFQLTERWMSWGYVATFLVVSALLLVAVS